MIAEAHLPASVARDVHAAEEDAGVVGRRDDGVGPDDAATAARGSAQFVLYVLMVLLVDDIVDTVTVNQQILLRKREIRETMSTN